MTPKNRCPGRRAGYGRQGMAGHEVSVVTATGVATFMAGVAGMQSNVYLALPALAAAAMLGSWTSYRQSRLPMDELSLRALAAGRGEPGEQDRPPSAWACAGHAHAHHGHCALAVPCPIRKVESDQDLGSR